MAAHIVQPWDQLLFSSFASIFAGGRGYSSSRNEMCVHTGKDCRCGESPPGVVIEENEQEDGE
jgi:hypothetical protein